MTRRQSQERGARLLERLIAKEEEMLRRCPRHPDAEKAAREIDDHNRLMITMSFAGVEDIPYRDFDVLNSSSSWEEFNEHKRLWKEGSPRAAHWELALRSRIDLLAKAAAAAIPHLGGIVVNFGPCTRRVVKKYESFGTLLFRVEGYERPIRPAALDRTECLMLGAAGALSDSWQFRDWCDNQLAELHPGVCGRLWHRVKNLADLYL